MEIFSEKKVDKKAFLLQKFYIAQSITDRSMKKVSWREAADFSVDSSHKKYDV